MPPVEQNKGTLRLRIAAVAAGMTLGVGLIALPDSDRRVLTFSDTHGPSLVDLVGSMLLALSWLPIPVAMWRCRRRVPARVWAGVGLLACAAAVALFVTITGDLGWWWLPSAAALALAQLVPVVYARLGPEAGPS